MIADDGYGFDPAAEACAGSSYGLRSMEERAQAVGGSLAVTSSPGQGTQVTVMVPPHPDWATGAGIQRNGAQAAMPQRGGKLRLLLVDDHALFRQSLQMLLEASGYTVVGMAADGREALQQARALRPDLILMDIEMPTVQWLDGHAADQGGTARDQGCDAHRFGERRGSL